MNTTFQIRKSQKKNDLLNFFTEVCKHDATLNNKSGICSINETFIHVIFGKTYIRIQDTTTDPKEITQLFYDVNLESDKYRQKIKNIITSSKEQTKKKNELLIKLKSYRDMMADFTADNKYHYEPYDICPSPHLRETAHLTNDDSVKLVDVIISDDNFTIDINMDDNGNLLFSPVMDNRITSSMLSITVNDTKDYIKYTDAAIKKVEKLRKVIAIIINDIMDLSNKINKEIPTS